MDQKSNFINMEKNKNIIIVILAIVLIGSLYFNFQSKSKIIDNADKTASKVSANALFEKKQECASYRPAIEKKLAELNFQNENVVTTNHLDEIWFSLSMNTCLYSSNEFWQLLKEKKIEYQYNIYDYLGNNLVMNVMEIPGSVSRLDALNAFNNRKEELKK